MARRFRLAPSGLTGAAMLLLVVVVSLLAPLLAPYDPNEVGSGSPLAPPSPAHPLGTDVLGRDVFSRLVYGGRVSVALGLAATCISMAIGLGIGMTAGYFGGWFDEGTVVVINIVDGLPGLSLAVAIAGVLGPRISSLLLALVLTSWPDFARIARGEALRIRAATYVEAALAAGAPPLHVLRRHILPNLAGPAVVFAAVKIGQSVLAIAGLSFLGLGLHPPIPDWGVMIHDARPYFRSHPHLLLAPGACIMLVTLGVNLLGDALRDRLDPRAIRR